MGSINAIDLNKKVMYSIEVTLLYLEVTCVYCGMAGVVNVSSVFNS